jgi:lipid-A-disaccharide synthase
MKYYIIAGEASGDLHASNLVKEIKKLDASAEFRCWGGDLLKAQGATLVKHYRDLAFMGFAEVIMNLRTILRNIDLCKKDILEYKPDALILVDYPGFNLRIAEFAKEKGFRIFYYISPQVWAWKQSRVHKIKRVVDHMLVILPFEKEFYQRFDHKVDFVGHPLLDAIAGRKTVDEGTFRDENELNDKPIISLLPGSRKQEIAVKLPIMLAMPAKFPGYQFVIAGAPSLAKEYYEGFIAKSDAKIVFGKTYDLLSVSHAALVTSGTATLETALFNVPEVVCYKGSAVSYLIAKQLVKVKYISLVNLIMDREVVKELIQKDLNEKNLEEELKRILSGPVRERILSDYAELRNKLGGSGASAKAAALIMNYLGKK